MATKLIFSLLIIVSVLVGNSFGQLSTDYYSKSCPKVYRTINPIVKAAIAREKRMGASLLRLHFHDCFVQGCDASLLLDDTPTFTGEKTAAPNNNSLRGFDIIDDIKSEVESVCPGIVSCADILAIIARDAVCILGGPKWDVKVGRRDTRTASLATANSGVIPPPTATLDQLRTRFQARGLSTTDLVALSGAHSIGQARCTLFRNRIYNETNIDASFAQLRQQNCPRPIGSGDDNLAIFDGRTPNTLDNAYYKNLRDREGLLHSDQVLYNGGSTDSLVETYSSNPEVFARDFAAAMIRMGDFRPLTGSDGEIRLNCRKIN